MFQRLIPLEIENKPAITLQKLLAKVPSSAYVPAEFWILAGIFWLEKKMMDQERSLAATILSIFRAKFAGGKPYGEFYCF